MKTQDSRTKKWKVVVPVIIIVLVVCWYWFRPERLVTNRRVDEAFPAINDSQTQILESGNFHSGTHLTEGTATVYRIAKPSSSVHRSREVKLQLTDGSSRPVLTRASLTSWLALSLWHCRQWCGPEILTKPFAPYRHGTVLGQ